MAFSAAIIVRKVNVSAFSKGLPEAAPERLPSFDSFFSDACSSTTQKGRYETSSFKADTLTRPSNRAHKSWMLESGIGWDM
jgi:hypothetical protein